MIFITRLRSADFPTAREREGRRGRERVGEEGREREGEGVGKHLLGEDFEFALDTSVPQTESGQRFPDLLGSTCKTQREYQDISELPWSLARRQYTDVYT